MVSFRYLKDPLNPLDPLDTLDHVNFLFLLDSNTVFFHFFKNFLRLSFL